MYLQGDATGVHNEKAFFGAQFYDTNKSNTSLHTRSLQVSQWRQYTPLDRTSRYDYMLVTSPLYYRRKTLSDNFQSFHPKRYWWNQMKIKPEHSTNSSDLPGDNKIEKLTNTLYKWFNKKKQVCLQITFHYNEHRTIRDKYFVIYFIIMAIEKYW